MIIKQVTNQYFVCLKESPLSPIPLIDIQVERHLPCDCVYFGKVFEAMEQRLKVEGLTVYLTWDVERLPSYGDNVVAIVLGDEFSRIPRYIHQVRAVFKTLSMQPIIGSNSLLKPSYLNLMSFMQFLRVWVVRTPSLLNAWFHRIKSNKVAPIYDVPLGYYNQASLPIKPILERQYDFFFAGSLVTESYPIWSRRRWLRNPKDLARAEMLSALEKLQAKYPEFKIAIGTTDNFGVEAKFPKDTRSYSEKLMDAKICLAPRGSLFETFRFFEGLRYGCIIITEALPHRWFYQGSPAIQLSTWSELEQKITKIMQSPELKESKHEASIQWWQAKCSEVVVGYYMAEQINKSNSSFEKEK
ncbi:hypothetical protein UH38_03585 [Aliterella atlantica CENA595]|uniref:Exostosin family protein n=1 Tax=Aliterella atlantica CENA595 TaxID=1618023 RepID=A0A0D8ZXL9_9CYAN|nr:hypothetical protein UH38_03585 [Aliterella atlantica CENA595]